MSAVPASRVVLLTPPGRGAVACLAIEGPQASAILQRHVESAAGVASPLETWPKDRIRYGRWLSATSGAAERGPPEDVILVRRAPCRWELHCHGGAAAAPRIMADLQRSGCVAVPWRDWAAEREASPVRSAALALLADAPTERTATILLDQYLGAWDEFVAAVRAALAAGDLDAALAQLNATLSLAPLGRHLVQPWRVVLAGPPNVGKSSLLNALAGYRRAIVHDQPGTTRDRLTVDIALDGWPIELTDTAGLRASNDLLEAAGVARAEAELAAADVVVLVFDVAVPWEPEHADLAARRTDAILVHNKADLLPAGADSAGHMPADRPPGLPTSATIGSGLDRLTEHIVARLVPRSPPSGAAVPILALQVEQLLASVEALRGGDRTRALNLLSASRMA